MPNGQLPVMYVEDDGVKKVYGQSNAILRYIGKLGGKHFLKIIPYQGVCLFFTVNVTVDTLILQACTRKILL